MKVRYEGKTLVEDMDFQKLVEQVLIYKKVTLNLVKKSNDYSFDKFCWKVEELGKPEEINLGGKKVYIFKPDQYRIVKVTPSADGLKEIWATGKILDGNSSGRFFRDYLTGRVKSDGYGALYKVEGIGDDAHGARYFTGPKREGATKGKYYQGVPNSVISGDKTKKESPIVTFYDMADSFGNCRHEGGVDFRDGKKPIKFIQNLMNMVELSPGDIVLDCFAGSCSTAHAVMDKNVEEGNQIRFINVQLPELIKENSDSYGAGFRTITDIGAERIRRAGKKLISENPEKIHDLGFRYFRLDKSNIKIWNPEVANLDATLLTHQEHLIEGRSEYDVLYELLLKRGVDLSVPIEERTISGRRVFSIGYGVLFACMDESISREQVEDIAQAIIDWHKELAPDSETHVFFRDSAFRDDVSKTNMAAILEQSGISHVRSL